MKAIRLHAPGGPEQLVVEKAPMPDLRDGDVLVRVLSCGLTRGELAWGPTTTDENGKSRLPSIPGHDLCGIVEKTAPGVKTMGEGTIVIGLASGDNLETVSALGADQVFDYGDAPFEGKVTGRGAARF